MLHQRKANLTYISSAIKHVIHMFDTDLVIGPYTRLQEPFAVIYKASFLAMNVTFADEKAIKIVCRPV